MDSYEDDKSKKTDRQEYQLLTDLSDEEYDRMFPEGTRTPTQMKMRLRHVITTGLNNLHRFPGDGDENEVAEGGPFDFSHAEGDPFIFMNDPPIIHFDGVETSFRVPLWRIYLDDGRVIDVVVSQEIAPTVFIDTREPWVIFKQGDPHGASKILMMVPFEIITLVQNLSRA